MRWPILIYAFLFFLLFVLQLSYWGSFGLGVRSFNFLLLLLVLAVNLFSLRSVLLLAVASGLLLDIYSSQPFGEFLLVFFVVAAVLEFLFLNFFTNRSLYSLIFLGLIAVAVYDTAFFLVSGFCYLVGVGGNFYALDFWGLLAREILMVLALLACFGTINRWSKSFKPIFLK